MNVADVIVVGLGAVGSALVDQLARRGVRVTGIDRFDPPHDQGSSHGQTRITRLAVGEGADFVPIVQRSHALWPQLEAESGERLMQRTGILLVGAPASAAAAYHGQPDFLAQTRALAQRFGIAHEMLDAASVRARFPAFAPAPGDLAYFEPEGGVLFPEACIRAQLALAERAGATLLRRRRMLRLQARPGGVTVHTDRGPLHAAHVVLCTGAWLPGQVGGTLAGKLRVLRQVLHWFEADRPDWFAPAACPAFMWLHGSAPSDAFYGFPRVDGRDGVKVATEQFSTTCDPDAVPRAVDPRDAQDLFAQQLAGRLRGLGSRVLHDATCLYTMAADGRFVVDRHPEMDHVTLVSPCSGHGFKHSAGLGESLAQQLAGQVPACDLSAFRLVQ